MSPLQLAEGISPSHDVRPPSAHSPLQPVRLLRVQLLSPCDFHSLAPSLRCVCPSGLPRVRLCSRLGTGAGFLQVTSAPAASCVLPASSSFCGVSGCAPRHHHGPFQVPLALTKGIGQSPGSPPVHTASALPAAVGTRALEKQIQTAVPVSDRQTALALAVAGAGGVLGEEAGPQRPGPPCDHHTGSIWKRCAHLPGLEAKEVLAPA